MIRFRRWLRKDRPAGSARRRNDVRPTLEGLEERVVLYSASGNAWPNPQLITISFMPDGTNFAGKSSNLIASMNAMFPNTNWQNIILQAAQSWAAQTNINFALVSDDGEPEGGGPDQQGYANYGDIRIGGYHFGSTTLAQAFMPPPVNNYSAAGDIAFNTGQVFRSGSTYDLFTVAAHEIGHALGLYHSTVAAAEMYATYNGVKNSLNSDDIAGIQAIYGGPRKPDVYNSNGASDGTQATAADLTSLVNSGTLTGVATGLDLTKASQVEWFKLTAPAGTNGTLKVSATSEGLSLLRPSLTVENASGTVVDGVTGASGSTVWASIGQVVAGQVYYIKMTGADSSVFGTGAYGLTLNFGNNPDPTVPRPNTTMPNGNPISSGGGQALAVNYETQVNTTTAGAQQTTPDRNTVAMDALGNYVVVWASQNQDGSGWGVYAQRYSAAGAKVGGEFRVNTTTAGDQTNPSVAMDSAGDFVVTWQSQNQDGSGWGVYARQYGAAGLPLTGEFQVNTYTNSDQMNPVVAMNGIGGFAIAWQSQNQDGSGWGVYAQRYNADGTKAGGEFQVNTTSAGNEQTPAAALDDSGDLLITWVNYSGSTWAIYGQQYTPAGVPLGGQFTVNTTQNHTVTNPSIVMNDRGNAVSVWTGGNATDAAGVLMQQFTISFNQEASDGFYAQGDPNDPDQAHTTPAPPPMVTLPPGGGAPGGGGAMPSLGSNGAGDPGGRPLVHWMKERHRPERHHGAPRHPGGGRSPRRDGPHGPVRPGRGLSPSAVERASDG